MKLFYEPTQDQLTKLESGLWIASYSGGKDSTSLVTWLEYLRRSGWISCETPRLVMSDTGIEYGFLQDVCHRLIEALRDSGWICDVVEPETRNKFYVRIFGRGLPPVSPKMRGMRWCTVSTKIQPMRGYKNNIDPNMFMLSGIRWGESQIRDEKLLKAGCRAGGECGLPPPDVKDRVYSPIVEWTDCQVFDWLIGGVSKQVLHCLLPFRPIMQELVRLYNVKKGPSTLDDKVFKRDIKMQRFGCIGCPAVSVNSSIRNVRENDPSKIPFIKKIYRLWYQIWEVGNRLKPREGKKSSPIKMESRKRLFVELLKIQEQSGMVLVTEKDIQFIYKCWEDKVYPRGWSEADERR
jgi:DNA sulfur modification protein DndC